MQRQETAYNRSFFCEEEENPHLIRYLADTELNVRTYYFNVSIDNVFPGRDIVNPPNWLPQSVSAHANASDTAKFFKVVLEHYPTEGTIERYVSSIHCIEDNGNHSECYDCWWSKDYQQAFFGQCLVNGEFRCYAIAQDIVAHEFCHALSSWTAKLEYVAQSGALDESYADIFGILVANFHEPEISRWNWEIGHGFGDNGGAIRDLSTPTRCAQPDHMDNYRQLSPNQRPRWDNDWGYVHHNSGIHNKAAYNLLTSQDEQGNYLFTNEIVAVLFYQALIRLGEHSGFSDSRRAIVQVAKTLFRRDPTRGEKLQAIARAFDQVGISE